MTSSSLTYADSGVNIDAGNRLVDRIKPFAKATDRAGVMGGLGGFGGLFDLRAAGYDDPILVSSTDGVGTKLKIAQALNRHDTIGIDLVAMCVNDLVVQGAEPLFFLDYFATGKLSVETAAAVVAGIAEGCKQAGCALLGGETAEMPGMYAPGEYDLAGFSVGAVEREAILPRPDILEGDIVLGLASSGVHSNGYSLVRKILEKEKLDYTSAAPFAAESTLGDILLTPTRIYVRSCLAAIRSGQIKALAHITGGGLSENIPRILPPGTAVEIDTAGWELPPLFVWLRDRAALPPAELYKTFNCGIGMVLIVPQAEVAAVTSALGREGEIVHRIGQVVAAPEPRVIYR